MCAKLAELVMQTAARPRAAGEMHFNRINSLIQSHRVPDGTFWSSFFFLDNFILSYPHKILCIKKSIGGGSIGVSADLCWCAST